MALQTPVPHRQPRDRLDTDGIAFYCTKCYSRKEHDCSGRLDYKARYRIEHDKESRNKRRQQPYRQGFSRCDNRTDPNTQMENGVTRMISDLEKLKSYYCLLYTSPSPRD